MERSRRNQETRKKINNIDKLVRQNLYAAPMAATHTQALLYHTIQNPFFGAVVHGTNVLKLLGYEFEGQRI